MSNRVLPHIAALATMFVWGLTFVCTKVLLENGDIMASASVDPKKKLIEYLQKHMRVTFTEKEIDASFEKGDSELFLEEIHRRQKVSHRGKGCHFSGKICEKGHRPSVKIIPATK